MSRFLFVVPPLVGHINPAVGVAAELASRGHRVAWAGAPELLRRLAGGGAAVHPCGPEPGTGVVRPPDVRGPGALKFLWRHFLVPLAEDMMPGVEKAIAEFGPDVVVADQQALAGGLAAERLGVRWATSATTPAEIAGALDGMPKAGDWIGGLIEELRRQTGGPADAADPVDPRFSPHLVLAFTTEALVGRASRGGERIRYVGPSLAARPPAESFPWEWLDPARPTVLVTLGTANADAGARFLGECREAARVLAGRFQTVIADPAGSLAPCPADEGDVLVRPWVPQLALLRRVSAVVCHAGHNTVCEALWHGVPLVVAPIRDDQPVVAGQVVEAGAGVRVRFGRVRAPMLVGALEAVLGEPAHRIAAGRVAASFRAAGGARVAADHLERLASKEGL